MVPEEQYSIAAQQIEGLIDKMGKYRITLSDLKPTNILITKNSPMLTDLDAMTAHRCKWIYRLRREKDITRFGEPFRSKLKNKLDI